MLLQNYYQPEDEFDEYDPTSPFPIDPDTIRDPTLRRFEIAIVNAVRRMMGPPGGLPIIAGQDQNDGNGQGTSGTNQDEDDDDPTQNDDYEDEQSYLYD